MGPCNLTEYLFADKYGEVTDQIDKHEINQIYMAYLQSLIDSYERLKVKFNQFQMRCLTEKQKRESGLIAAAPAIIMPMEKDRQDLEVDFGQTQEDPSVIGSSRMGGRIGARIGGLGDQDGDVPPDDIDANMQKVNDNMDRDEENKQGENMYNVEDETDQRIDGQINHLMMQGSIAQKGVKAIGGQHQKANDSRNANQLVALTERRPGTSDPYELSYQLVYDINIVST